MGTPPLHLLQTTRFAGDTQPCRIYRKENSNQFTYLLTPNTNTGQLKRQKWKLINIQKQPKTTNYRVTFTRTTCYFLSKSISMHTVVEFRAVKWAQLPELVLCSAVHFNNSPYHKIHDNLNNATFIGKDQAVQETRANDRKPLRSIWNKWKWKKDLPFSIFIAFKAASTMVVVLPW